MIKYPNSKKIYTSSKISAKKRGLSFEADINSTNEFYLINNVAIIHKKPTPIKPITVKVIEGKGKLISKAVFETPSTTDYNGLYKGHYIDFEAKETHSSTSFSLNNIHSHQIKHLIDVSKHGGIAFIIIRFVKLDKVFLYSIEQYIDFISNSERKSIPINEFEQHGYVIKNGYNPRYDYLKIVDELYFKEVHHASKNS